MMRWLFLLLGDFESGLKRLLIFPSAMLFVLLHLLFCAEDAVYIGTHGLEFFVIILEIMVSIVLGVLLNRKLLFFCPEVFHSNVSINRTMSKPIKCVYYAIVLFGNVVVNKIPSRHIRKWFYQMLGAKIGKRSTICRRADILFPKGLNLADGVSIGWFVDLDARGGIYIDHDTNISSHMSNQIGDRLKQLGHQIVTKNTRITEERESTKALVTDISHQLKTPMAALKTCFYIYLDASDADEKMEFLKRSEAQLEKLEQLIASLMNISRLETAMISLTKEPILLSDLLVDAVNGVYEKARRKNIEISLQKTENIALQLDKHWTTEAVINVLDNAVKYSPQNSHITISIEKQHFYTLVKITDEGIGISQSEYNKIFQRFYRSNHSYVKKTEGSGVGLYLTRMILEQQGGLIRVESVPEKGSTFILQFRN